jgi:hypothetical protein
VQIFSGTPPCPEPATEARDWQMRGGSFPASTIWTIRSTEKWGCAFKIREMITTPSTLPEVRALNQAHDRYGAMGSSSTTRISMDFTNEVLIHRHQRRPADMGARTS